jgi:signal transduction histidine kinase/PAS domain-containing protein
MLLRDAMGTATSSLLFFSARASGGDLLSPDGAQRIDELPACDAGAHGRDDVLFIDVGVPGDVDPARLASIEGYAARRTAPEAARPGVSLGLVGDVGLLGSPEHVVWLRADGVWPAWPSPGYREKAVEAVRARAALRAGKQEEIQRYRQLCRDLKIGAYCTTPDGATLVWADREVARILGYDTVSALRTSGRAPLQWYDDEGQHAELTRELEGPPPGPASVAVQLVRADGTRARARILAISSAWGDGRDVILGFLHDFSELVDEQEQITRQHLADLLDELGYAYFATKLDGSPLVSSQRDRELLDSPPETEARTAPRERWWAEPEEREKWLARLLADGKVTEYPVLLHTYQDRYRWVDTDCRVVENGAGEPVGVEGIYRDATASRFAKRMSYALSMVGASDEGVNDTAGTICEWAASLFDAPACALMLRDETHRRVFPTHVWLASGPWPGRPALAPGLILDERAIPWLETLLAREVHCEPAALVRADVQALFGPHAEAMHTLGVIPLRREGSDRDPAQPKAVVRGYLWIPITRPLTFSEDRFDSEFLGFTELCGRQINLAAGRDAFALVHDLLIERSSTAGVKDLDKTLGLARAALQARVPMEACSIFRTGIEERRTRLQLVSTSGLVGPEASASYELGAGLSGQTALGRTPRVSFDKTQEPDYLGKHVEKTSHTGQTWMGIPMVDRKGQTIGLIRCVNRLIGTDSPAVTGFSALDSRVVEEFAHACALLTELSLLQEERSRTLARITHEFRTPTVGIRNNVRYLESYYKALRRPEHKITAKLADLELDAQILVNLLQQVDMARGPDGSRGREARTQTNVRNIVQKTFFQLIPELTSRNISQDSVSIDLHGLPQLWLPRAAVAQIVFNLFTNAIKYARPDPQWFSLEIRADETPHAFRIHFRDRGIGVEEAYRERIFEEEFRAPSARRHDARGLGLGLKISRKLAGEFGGSLTLESTRDPTDFVLVLPKTTPPKL